ncbi:GyrI-like domain-containing protein [Alkalicoccus daliensis]|uniref:AraC family transcriptional regulator n=1 Tax=Alkalicoccus daliensis TaxID=745820 RepID=A0A1H0ERF3_9BACI|nr:hypothetical protein [Alkalicoccus daliensis]SDN84883.1 AraC family transcriptional regulator [Alkalicoccus daliensis]
MMDWKNYLHTKFPGLTLKPSLCVQWEKSYTEWSPSNGYEIADIPCIEAYTDPDAYKDDSFNQIWLAVK